VTNSPIIDRVGEKWKPAAARPTAVVLVPNDGPTSASTNHGEDVDEGEDEAVVGSVEGVCAQTGAAASAQAAAAARHTTRRM
jgi:hypothetical protein